MKQFILIKILKTLENLLMRTIMTFNISYMIIKRKIKAIDLSSLKLRTSILKIYHKTKK